MKLSLTLFLILATTFLKLRAQTNAIQFGIAAGINTTSLSRIKAPEIQIKDADKNAFGYLLGAYARFNIERLSFQPAVVYNTIASKTTEEIVSGDIAYRVYGKWRLHYIQVPVSILYHFPVTGGNLFVGAGPYVSRALSGRFITSSTQSSEAPNASNFGIDAKFGSDERSNFKSFDYGINALTGFEFDNGTQINLIYNTGLSNIQVENFYYNSSKIKSLAVSVGFKF